MLVRSLIGGLMLYASFVNSANAQSDTFTQVGHWSCTPPDPGRDSGPPEFTCPTVTFPTEFGGKPDVVFSNTPQSSQTQSTDFRNITAQGFTPIVNRKCYTTYHNRPHGNGRVAIQNCFHSHTLSGDWIAVGPALFAGTVKPKYMVLTVVYAPPGSNGGKNKSNVSYAAGSTTGTTTSSSQSFKQGYSISAEAEGGLFGNTGGGGLSFEYSKSDTNDQSVDIKKSVGSKISYDGPGHDGVDHAYDAIYVWLNPTVDVRLTASSARWKIDATESADIPFLFVSELKDPSKMQPGLANKLKQLGFTQQDFNDILKHDPLADPSYTLDPSRYVRLNSSFPYHRPLTASDPVPMPTWDQTSSSTSTAGSTVEETYKVGMSMSQSGKWLEFAKLTMKETASWEWTNKSSQSSSSGHTESASVTVGGPGFDYNENVTEIQVYFDTLYKTFAFVPISSPPAVTGILKSATGEVARPWTEVTLIENGVKHQTFTDAKGEFSFFGNIGRPATIQVNGVTIQVIPPLPPPPKLELQLKTN